MCSIALLLLGTSLAKEFDTTDTLPVPLRGKAFVRDGMTFIQDNQLLITGRSWVAATEISLKPFEEQLNYLESEIKELNSLTSIKFVGAQPWLIVDAFDFVPALMNRELSLIEEKITSLREDFRGLDSVLTNVTRKTREIGSQKSAPARSKRGLFNFVGEASSFLFGTLAESHLQQLNERISDAETNGKLIYNMETEMATLITVSYTHLTLPTKRIV